MKISSTFAAIALVGLATAVPHHRQTQKRPQGSGSAGNRAARTAKAVYFQTNDATQNQVVALPIERDGSLGKACFVSTGGKGGTGVEGNSTSHADALFSQDAVRVGDNYLFAVNSGDNTLSMFNINPQDGSLQMAGTADTLGEFPVAVAYSSALKQACVLNGGAKDGVTCYCVEPENGLRTADRAPRPLNLGQSTPPVGPEGTASDIFFNGDSSILYVTVKGNPAKNDTGFIAAYPVRGGRVSRKAVTSSPQGTVVLFGSAISNKNTFIATDASFGYSILSLNRDLSVQSRGNFKIDGQGATCWASFSQTTNSYFVTDVKVNHVVEADANSGNIVGQYNLSNGNPGNIDTQVGGDFLYVLSPLDNGAAVAVMNLSGGQGKAKEMQTFTVQGAGIASMGMTVYPAISP